MLLRAYSINNVNNNNNPHLCYNEELELTTDFCSQTLQQTKREIFLVLTRMLIKHNHILHVHLIPDELN